MLVLCQKHMIDKFSGDLHPLETPGPPLALQGGGAITVPGYVHVT